MRLSAGLVPPERWGRSSVGLVVVTAADRAAATCRRGVTEEGPVALRCRALMIDKGKITKPLQVRGGSVSRRGPNQLAGNRAHLTWGRNLRRNSQAYSQLLSGREREGGAFLRKAASLAYHIRFDNCRGLDQVAGNRAHLAWGRTSKGTVKLIPNCSSGGGPGEGLLAKKPPPPEFFIPNILTFCEVMVK